MPEITNFDHNGIRIEMNESPPSLGPLGGHVLGLVGTSPDHHADIIENVLFRVANFADCAKLDTVGDEAGTLYHAVYETLKVAKVPIYVVVVPEGLDDAETVANIIGGVDGASGQVTGLALLPTAPEVPTLIAAPGFSHEAGLRSELVSLGKRMMAEVLLDAVDGPVSAVVEDSESMGGEGLGYEAAYVAYPMPKIYSKAAQDDIIVSPSVLALGCFARRDPWESPGNLGVNATDMTRQVNYNILDDSTDGDLLNRYGVGYFARTSRGGFSLIGNRSVMGDFISHVGLRYAIARKLVKSSQRAMAENLTMAFMEQEVRVIEDWGQTLVAEGVLPLFECYLHPDLNTVENYKNGKWYLVLNYARYSPNETMVYQLNADDGLIEQFLEDVLNG
ncbi:MAG: phage tail protein [Pseudomonadota bacterium]|nr:phage tail protein [Pseudomonadota bacterium]